MDNPDESPLVPIPTPELTGIVPVAPPFCPGDPLLVLGEVEP
jgi:hypothetical protein